MCHIHIDTVRLSGVSVPPRKGNHIGKKRKFHSEKKVALTQDHCFRKSRLTIQATRKLDCPVTLTVKKIFRFPEFKINVKKKNRCC